jgi:phosphoglycerate dehydrogenase-like enzyme
MKVAYLETVPPSVEEIVRSCAPPELEVRFRRAGETPEAAARDADFLLVATCPVTAEVLAAAPRLRLVQHQGVGYDNIDLRAAARAGVPVALTPEGTFTPVAEHVLLLVLALYRRLGAAHAALREGRWLQWELRSGSFDLLGKCMGIVGLGSIGREVAKRARAFECRLLYTDVAPLPREVEESLGVEYRPLDDLLAEADVVTLHVPLTPATRGLIGERELARMKPTALLINTARGPLVDEDALYRALVSGRLLGAGLDVFAREPPGDHPLLKLESVVATPHVAAGTRDALETKLRAGFGNMLRVARGEPPRNEVRLP